MVCRMLVATGQLPVAQLLDDFKLMALNKNEEHELNRKNPNFIHGDGWGIVIGKSGKLECYKKEVACWKDPKFLDYYSANVDFVILHARRASLGTPVSYNFTHPFEKEGWYFCHNGTIYNFKSKERSDSEQFFTLLLDNIKGYSDVKDTIRNTVNQMKEYSALNFILANGNKVYILVRHQKYPDYYTMKYLVEENYIIVSSERLPSFDGKWKKVDNNTILVLDIISHRIETFDALNGNSM